MASVSDAMKEAIIAVPSGEVFIHTLELRYDGLLDDNGDPTSIYIAVGMGGEASLSSDDLEPLKDKVFKARLEDSDAINGGKVVKFIPIPLKITYPKTTKGVLPNYNIEIDDVSEELLPHFNNLADNPAVIKQIYREFLLTTKDIAPEVISPIPFEVQSVNMSDSKVTLRATAPQLADVVVPNYQATVLRFPTLS